MGRNHKTLLVSLLTAIIVITVLRFGWLERLELLLIDLRIRVFSSTQSAPIALVALDQNSLKEIGVWPSPRSNYASVLHKVDESGAKAILVDFNFASPSHDPAEDMELVRAVQNLSPVILPIQMEERINAEGALIRNVTLPFPELEEAATALGGITLALDHDGVVRKMPFPIVFGDKVYQPFGVVGAQLVDSDISIDIPVGALINMSLGTLRSIPTVPFIKVIRGDFDKEIFQNKVVLIGATSEDLHDFWRTAIGVVPGVYIQAAVLETALNKSWYVRQGKWSSALVVILVSIVLGSVLGRTRWRSGVLILLAFYALVIFVSFISFRSALLIDMLPLLVLGIIQLPVQIGLHARMTEQVLDLERKKTSAILKMSDLREAEDTGKDAFTVPLVLLRQTLNLNRIRVFLREGEDPSGWQEKVVIGDDKTGADETLLLQTFEGGEVIRIKGKDPVPTVYVPLMTVRKTIGVLYAEGSPSFECSEDDIALLLAFATNTAYFLESSELNERVRSLYVNSIGAITKALDSKDQFTSAHSELTLDYVEKFGRACGLEEDKIEVLHIGALLHDIGKIGIPDGILTKPGKLTDEEFKLIKEHPLKGYEIIRDMPFPEEVKLIVRHHHERFDGKGYPDGLKGEQISTSARIFSIVDVFEALTGHRPYREPMGKEEAKLEIKRHAGTQFDPEFVRIFLSLV